MTNLNINKRTKYFDEEIDIFELIKVLWKRKTLIVLITFFSAIASVIYALSLPNIYTSKSILAPTQFNESLKSQLGSYSSLAGLAGFDLGGESGSKTTEVIERIKSYDFFVEQFLPNIEFNDLVAAQNWDKQSNKIKYVSITEVDKPTYQDAYEKYKKILFVTQDKQTSFVSIQIDHISPYIAQEWLMLIIKNANLLMREIDKKVAINSLDYLNTTISTINLSETKVAISNIIENQIKTLALTEATEDYVLRPISQPIAPEKKSSPTRSFICITGTFLGFLFSLLLSLALNYLNSRKTQS